MRCAYFQSRCNRSVDASEMNIIMGADEAEVRDENVPQRTFIYLIRSRMV
jgi:hypothetical protein